MGKQQKIHFGFFLVAALALTSFGPLSLALSCVGIFYPPLSYSLGIGTGILSYYTSILWVSALLFLPLIGNLMSTLDARVCVSGAVILIAVDFVALSFTSSLWHFYICAFFMGIGVAVLLFIAPSTLINRWFLKHAGACLGVVMACTGIGGMVWSAIGGVLIVDFGWEFTYRIFALIALATALPVSLIFIASYPHNKGLVPYGSKEASSLKKEEATKQRQRASSLGELLGNSRFLTIFALAFILNFGMAIYHIIPSHISSQAAFTDMPLLGAIAASTAMAGQTISKLSLGVIGDRWPRFGVMLGLGLGVLGLASLAFIPSFMVIVLVAAFCFGLFYGVANVMMPLVTAKSFPHDNYPKIYSKVSIAAAFGSIVSGFAVGTIADLSGGYMPAMVLVIVLLVVGILLARSIKVEY